MNLWPKKGEKEPRIRFVQALFQTLPHQNADVIQARPRREEVFVSGGHDDLVKMWDWRSCRTPLYDLKGHEDKVMCVDWGERGVVASGGADNDMKLFKSNC